MCAITGVRAARRAAAALVQCGLGSPPVAEPRPGLAYLCGQLHRHAVVLGRFDARAGGRDESAACRLPVSSSRHLSGRAARLGVFSQKHCSRAVLEVELGAGGADNARAVQPGRRQRSPADAVLRGIDCGEARMCDAARQLEFQGLCIEPSGHDASRQQTFPVRLTERGVGLGI